MRSDLYARKSNQDGGRSVARQERAWRADCAAEGIETGRVLVDPDFSASRYARKDRPEWAELVAHVRATQCEMVSIWEVTRGSRRASEWSVFLDLCQDQGVVIRLFGDGEEAQTYDPRRWRDKEHLLRLGIAAEGESEQIRRRSMAGTEDAAAQGRPPGPLLYGYAREYGAPSGDALSVAGKKRREIRQVINEPEAEIVRALATGALAGVPLQFMARVLNAWEVPTASGRGEWTGHGINRLLRNPGYEGHRVHGGKVAARNAWPAILDADTAARVRRMLETPGRRSHADSSLKYLLSGAVLCGACERPMKGDIWKGKNRYECTRSGCSRVTGPMGPMDEAVSEFVIARLSMPNAAAVFTPATDDAAVSAADAQLRALTDRRDELYAEAAKPGGPSMALVAAAERELLPRIEAASARLRRLQTPPALRGYDPADLAAEWDSGKYTVGERRRIVLGLTDRLVLSPVGKGGRWSFWRLACSRWRGDAMTWGEHWEAEGLVNLL